MRKTLQSALHTGQLVNWWPQSVQQIWCPQGVKTQSMDFSQQRAQALPSRVVTSSSEITWGTMASTGAEAEGTIPCLRMAWSVLGIKLLSRTSVISRPFRIRNPKISTRGRALAMAMSIRVRLELVCTERFCPSTMGQRCWSTSHWTNGRDPPNTAQCTGNMASLRMSAKAVRRLMLPCEHWCEILLYRTRSIAQKEWKVCLALWWN